MSHRVWPLRLSLSSIALVCAVAGQPLRAANFETANPEQGAVIDGAYVNAYFGLRYTMPPGWKAGPQPPPPSAGGYYVLGTPMPPPGAKATILIAAQDTFFAMPPLADAGEMTRNLAQSVSNGSENAAAMRGAATIAGHSFLTLDLPGVPLSRMVLATDIRCHVVIFTFTGADRGRLRQLAASLNRLSLDQDRSVPDCVKDYATAQTIRRKVEPVLAEPQFVKVPVRIIIGADGGVEHIHVIRAFAAQQKSIEGALMHWRFEPYRAKGRAREVETGLTFEFKPTGRPN
jgi:hypothetical protein